jgi:alpha-beta hydrolase superfamily lysophospholipase
MTVSRRWRELLHGSIKPFIHLTLRLASNVLRYDFSTERLPAGLQVFMLIPSTKLIGAKGCRGKCRGIASLKVSNMNAATIQTYEFHFRSRDGLRIACTRWGCCGSAAGVVQIAHGLGEHVARYTGLIETLVAAGLVVYGHDHRGHGRTAQSPKDFGDFGPGGFDLLVEDMAKLREIAREENPNTRLVLLGHSMGSFAAQQYILDRSEDIDGLALSGSGALDGLVRLAQSSTVTPAEIVNAGFEPARTPCDWLSRDPEIVDAFMNDPMCFGWLQPSATASFFGAASTLADPARLQHIRHGLPIYVFSGSEDPVGQQLEGVRVLLERYRAAGGCSISYCFYPGGRHEMLNEINRDEVRSNLLRWISGVLSQTSQSATNDGAHEPSGCS